MNEVGTEILRGRIVFGTSNLSQYFSEITSRQPIGKFRNSSETPVSLFRLGIECTKPFRLFRILALKSGTNSTVGCKKLTEYQEHISYAQEGGWGGGR